MGSLKKHLTYQEGKIEFLHKQCVKKYSILDYVTHLQSSLLSTLEAVQATSLSAVQYRLKIEAQHKQKEKDREQDRMRCMIMDMSNQFALKVESFETSVKKKVKKSMTTLKYEIDQKIQEQD